MLARQVGDTELETNFDPFFVVHFSDTNIVRLKESRRGTSSN